VTSDARQRFGARSSVQSPPRAHTGHAQGRGDLRQPLPSLRILRTSSTGTESLRPLVDALLLCSHDHLVTSASRCRTSGPFPLRPRHQRPVIQLLHYGYFAPDRLHSCSGLLPYNNENARSTPLVQPNPIWTGYSPPPPGVSSTRLYFSSNVLDT
jgi:hypothetical protein